MKKLVLGLAMVCVAGNAFAQESDFEIKEQVLHSATHNLNIALNESTVLCSDADYGAKFLKILIPQLKDLTLLNHRNEGAGAPCVAAGMCRNEIFENGSLPSDIIHAEKPTEDVVAQIQVVRISVINHKEKICQVTLSERIQVPVRGVEFKHERQAELGERNYLDCL